MTLIDGQKYVRSTCIQTDARREKDATSSRQTGGSYSLCGEMCLFVYVSVYVLYCTILSYMCVSPLILRSKVGALSTELKTDGQSVFTKEKKKRGKGQISSKTIQKYSQGYLQ